MQYRNNVTGAVIDTECTIAGEHWEEVSLPPGAPAAQNEREVNAHPKKRPTSRLRHRLQLNALAYLLKLRVDIQRQTRTLRSPTKQLQAATWYTRRIRRLPLSWTCWPSDTDYREEVTAMAKKKGGSTKKGC